MAQRRARLRARFKHRFSKILPFPPFLLSTTPLPTHPFIVTAILAHVPAISGTFNAQLVDESIRHAVTGAVNKDVVTALLILALCPVHPGQMSGPSPLRLISLAYEIGSALGMEAMSRSAAKRTAQLCEPWWSEMLDRVLLVSRVRATSSLFKGSHPVGGRQAALQHVSGDAVAAFVSF